jgi:hypothetical protein
MALGQFRPTWRRKTGRRKEKHLSELDTVGRRSADLIQL